MNKGLEVIEAHHLFGTPYDAHRRRRAPAVDRPRARDACATARRSRTSATPTCACRSPTRCTTPSASTCRCARSTSPRSARSPSSRRTSTRSRACAWRARPAIAGGTAPCVLNAANEVAVHALPRRPAAVPRHPRGDRGRRSSAARRGRVHAFESLYEADREARAVAAELVGALRVSWLLAFLGFARADRPARARPLRGGQGGRHARRALRAVLPAAGRRRRAARPSTRSASIPLGGYVKITGMNPQEEIPPEVAHRAYYRQPVWKRIVVIGAGPRSTSRSRSSSRGVLLGSAAPVAADQRRRGARQGRLPAASVLQPGDQLVAVDGKRGDPRSCATQIATHTLRRTGKADGCQRARPRRRSGRARRRAARRVAITPVYDAARSGRCSASPSASSARRAGRGLGEAVATSVETMWDVTSATVDDDRRHLRAPRSARRSPASSAPTRRRASRSTSRPTARLFLLALISLSLGVINLFPFLPLDGGHIFWALAEKVRGRAIPFSVMERAGFVGFVLVIVLFVIGLTNDIGRLTRRGLHGARIGAVRSSAWGSS